MNLSAPPRPGHRPGLTFLLLALSWTAAAQYEQSAVTGTVRDQQGRAVPGASVQIQQSETGIIRSATSNSAGVFFVSALAIGNYSFVVSHTGFTDLRLSNVRLACWPNPYRRRHPFRRAAQRQVGRSAHRRLLSVTELSYIGSSR